MVAPRYAQVLSIALVGCTPAAEPQPNPCAGPGALSTCSAPLHDPGLYVDQGLRYFDTLDGSADPESEPDYGEFVARWEWPPWLYLTGYGRDFTLAVDELVLAAMPGTTVPTRDCRFFEAQPFARCRVSFDYEGQPCPIYEEFTFNEGGQVTFVEAWSDQPTMLPMDAGEDPWAEGEAVDRLSWRVPGLGTPDGTVDPTGPEMLAAAAENPLVADFADRTQDFWGRWSEAYEAAGDDLFARGCGW